jgi:glutathione S-transferase
MNGELVLYTNPMSRGRTVRWMLEELGQPYRTEVLDYGTTMKAPAYLAINPMGKVPALTHGGVVITEVAAICTYLADAFPRSGLAPAATDPARGSYLRWIHFAAPFEYGVTDKSMGVQITPELKGRVGYGSLDDVLATVEGHLSQQDYFAAGRFTAADVVLGAQLGWMIGFGMIDKRPAFDHYLARIMSRPAKVRADQIDNDLMPKPPA